MRATKNGWTIEGDPQEILALISGDKAEVPEKPRKAETAEKKPIDWGKAQALKDAGWSAKDIAEELHTTPAVIGRRLK